MAYELGDNFGIRLASELVAKGLKLRSERVRVVDRSIVYKGYLSRSV